jgi:hypothetical protein
LLLPMQMWLSERGADRRRYARCRH